MRLWSLHPKYLDAKGLVALWREGLLAKNVLEGNTKGYKHHPQLIRFKESESMVDSINVYLMSVYKEAARRNYNFNREKLDWQATAGKIDVTNGQMEYEWKHLLNKLKLRDPALFSTVQKLESVESHPLFNVVPGKIENWEIL